ncbi:hypothetical protein EK21DRAFT_93637 [Setomelanomma holmii]|uniref:Uncharacterized protein n=1 Tax=Setomelanomma holmii TaxID=210430 RepID=A0A9P4GZJ4_9PLEO|nr:hypothetical protein EK21DRAFT_93637 [Setomelanomma holmii]
MPNNLVPRFAVKVPESVTLDPMYDAEAAWTSSIQPTNHKSPDMASCDGRTPEPSVHCRPRCHTGRGCIVDTTATQVFVFIADGGQNNVTSVRDDGAEMRGRWRGAGSCRRCGGKQQLLRRALVSKAGDVEIEVAVVMRAESVFVVEQDPAGS